MDRLVLNHVPQIFKVTRFTFVANNMTSAEDLNYYEWHYSRIFLFEIVAKPQI